MYRLNKGMMKIVDRRDDESGQDVEDLSGSIMKGKVRARIIFLE